MRERLKDHPDKKKVVISHMVMNHDFVNWGQFENVDFFSAFLGSVKIGQLMEEFRVEHNFMGHVHLRKETWTEYCHYACTCLKGYHEWETSNLRREVDQGMIVVELE